MRFRTTVNLNGKTACGIVVPPEVVDALGAGKRPPVRVTISGYSYRTTIAPMGGRFLIGINADHRAAGGISAGDVVDVDLEVDTAPREVVTPDDLAAALDAEPVLRATFDAMSYTHRKEYVRALDDAKTAETRNRRLGKTLEMLRERTR